MSEFISNYTGAEKDETVYGRVKRANFYNMTPNSAGAITLDFSSIGNVVVLAAWIGVSGTIIIPYISGGGSAYQLGNNYWQAKILNALDMTPITTGTFDVYVAYMRFKS